MKKAVNQNLKMTNITKASMKDCDLLVSIGRQSFLESHGSSAPKKDIANYIDSKFTKQHFETEMQEANTFFYLLQYHEKPIGYSKITINASQKNITFAEVAKLERLYILQEFHHLKLGLELFSFNVKLSKQHKQLGMWLYVWVENKKAIAFYDKAGFRIIGSYDFKISETHSNPNHQMLLTF